MFMQECTVQPGRTSYLANIFFQQVANASDDGLDGAPIERGFVDMDYDETTLTAYYARQGATAAAIITVVDLTTLGTWQSGGLKKIHDTNMPGMVQFGVPNAAIAAGASDFVDIVISVATALAATAWLRIHLKTPPPIVIPIHIKPGSKSNIIPIPVQMASGGPSLTAITATDFTVTYQRLGEAAVSAAGVAGTVNTFTSNGFVFVTSGAQVQFCLPDAAVLHGAANGMLNVLITNPVADMIPVLLRISFARSLAI